MPLSAKKQMREDIFTGADDDYRVLEVDALTDQLACRDGNYPVLPSNSKDFQYHQPRSRQFLYNYLGHQYLRALFWRILSANSDFQLSPAYIWEYSPEDKRSFHTALHNFHQALNRLISHTVTVIFSDFNNPKLFTDTQQTHIETFEHDFKALFSALVNQLEHQASQYQNYKKGLTPPVFKYDRFALLSTLSAQLEANENYCAAARFWCKLHALNLLNQNHLAKHLRRLTAKSKYQIDVFSQLIPYGCTIEDFDYAVHREPTSDIDNTATLAKDFTSAENNIFSSDTGQMDYLMYRYLQRYQPNETGQISKRQSAALIAGYPAALLDALDDKLQSSASGDANTSPIPLTTQNDIAKTLFTLIQALNQPQYQVKPDTGWRGQHPNSLQNNIRLWWESTNASIVQFATCPNLHSQHFLELIDQLMQISNSLSLITLIVTERLNVLQMPAQTTEYAEICYRYAKFIESEPQYYDDVLKYYKLAYEKGYYPAGLSLAFILLHKNKVMTDDYQAAKQYLDGVVEKSQYIGDDNIWFQASKLLKSKFRVEPDVNIKILSETLSILQRFSENQISLINPWEQLMKNAEKYKPAAFLLLAAHTLYPTSSRQSTVSDYPNRIAEIEASAYASDLIPQLCLIVYCAKVFSHKQKIHFFTTLLQHPRILNTDLTLDNDTAEIYLNGYLTLLESSPEGGFDLRNHINLIVQTSKNKALNIFIRDILNHCTALALTPQQYHLWLSLTIDTDENLLDDASLPVPSAPPEFDDVSATVTAAPPASSLRSNALATVRLFPRQLPGSRPKATVMADLSTFDDTRRQERQDDLPASRRRAFSL